MRPVMSRFARLLHRHYWLSALLLGCLVLRAFVPAGYMLDTARGDLSLKMCSGLVISVQSDAGQDSGSSPQGSDGPTGHHGACPAGVPLLALAYALALSADMRPFDALLPAADAPALSSIPPSPSRLPRGPPSLQV
jgi:hypothetical protein